MNSQAFNNIMDENGEDDILQRLLNESGMLLELSKYQEDDNDEICDRVGFILDVGLNNLK